MPNLDDLINSEALDLKIDERARKVFFKSAANIKLFINPLAFLVLLLVGFIFTRLDTSVTILNSSLVAFSGELKEVRNQTILNKEAIVRLIDQQLISDYKK